MGLLNRIENIHPFLISLGCFEPAVSKLCQANSHKMYKYS